MHTDRVIFPARLRVPLLVLVLAIAAGMLVLMAQAIYQALTGNLEDFYLYYLAASGFQQKLDIYSMARWDQWEPLARSLGVPTYAPPYRYPPLLAVMIMPLLSLPPRPAGLVWTVFNGIAIAGAVTLLATIVPGGLRRLPWMWVLAAVFVPTLSTLYSGQVNALVLLSIVLALWAFKREKPVGAGLALSLGVVLKLMPLTLVAYFLWRRQWRVVGGAIAGALVLTSVCLPFVGWEAMWSYAQHLLSKADPQILQVNPLNQSLLGFFGRLLTPYSWGTPWGDNPRLAWTLGRGLGFAFLVATFVLCSPGRRRWRDFVFEEVSLVIIATLLFPSIAWYHLQLLLLIPIFTLLWNRPESPHSRKLTWIVVGCLVMIDLQGMLWPVLLKQPLLLSLPLYAMLVLWVTLAWVLLAGSAPSVSGSRRAANGSLQ